MNLEALLTWASVRADHCALLGSKTMTIKDKPRSYTELFVDAAKQYSSQLYLLGFLFFSLFTVVGVATLIHIQFIEIPVISSAEAAEGVRFKEQVYLPGLYLNIALYITAGAACLHSLVTS